jgi:hypothetical protein
VRRGRIEESIHHRSSFRQTDGGMSRVAAGGGARQSSGSQPRRYLTNRERGSFACTAA